MRNLVIDEKAFEDISYWLQNDKKVLKRIFDLIKNIKSDSFDGLGKPEPLRHQLKGMWSRRINREHRLIYSVEDDYIKILACRFHYTD
jgi:toxin YoeB